MFDTAVPPARPARPARSPRSPFSRILLRLTAPLVALLVMVPTAAVAMDIEDFASYQPQSRCSPSPKAGTVALLNWLQRRYKGTGSLGISRACGHGGVSEHKEGRALDWAVNHSSARDRAYVAAFLERIFKTDKHGNDAALARRMGIMYLIWNDHIYSAYRGFEKRDYLSSSCKKRKRCSVTLRHRNHVHISLSRAGGRGDTSWYHRNDPNWEFPTKPEPLPDTPTDPGDDWDHDGDDWDHDDDPLEPETEPVLDLDRVPYARVVVPADGDSVLTGFSLLEGKTYKLTAAGLFRFGGPHQIADTACAWRSGPEEWRPRPNRAARRDHGALDLRVNGKGVFGAECQADHVYSVTYRPTRTKPLRLRVANNDGSQARGALVVTVSARGQDVAAALPTYPRLSPAPVTSESAPRGFGLLAERLSVPADDPDGVTTRRELEQGAQYRITVSGSVNLGDGVRSDGECLRMDGAWWRHVSLDRRVPGADHGDLYVDGVPLGGQPDCADRSYAVDYTATRDGRLRLAIWDPVDTSDNRGALDVRIQRISGFAEPGRAKWRKPGKTRPWHRATETLTVASDDADGVRTRMRFRKGERLQVIVEGRQRSAGTRADATCVRSGSGWTLRDDSLAVDQDPLELFLEGRGLRWRAVAGDDCSPEHVYTRLLRVKSSGPLRLGVLDLDHRDNTGELTVTLVRGKQRWTDRELLDLVSGAA